MGFLVIIISKISLRICQWGLMKYCHEFGLPFYGTQCVMLSWQNTVLLFFRNARYSIICRRSSASGGLPFTGPWRTPFPKSAQTDNHNVSGLLRDYWIGIRIDKTCHSGSRSAISTPLSACACNSLDKHLAIGVKRHPVFVAVSVCLSPSPALLETDFY